MVIPFDAQAVFNAVFNKAFNKAMEEFRASMLKLNLEMLKAYQEDK